MPVMRNAGGYVRVYRSLLDWEWYDDDACVRLMLHLILSVNWESKEWHGQTILPGQTVTSMEKLGEKLRLSRSAVRRAMDKLKATGEITVQTNNHWTTVTLANWGEYQEVQPTTGRQKSRPTTNQQPTNNRPPATTKEEKALEEGNTEVSGVDQAFDAVWVAYERYGSKAKALSCWRQLTPEDRQSIIDKIPGYVENTPGCEYRKQLEGWINPVNRLWERPLVRRVPVSGPAIHKLPEATGWITDKKSA